MTARGPVAGRVRLDDITFHPHNVRVDLGDLRDLAASIKEFGVLTPVVLEQRGDTLRVRQGHRRVAAARYAGLDRITAIVHPDALADDEWLRAAVHENTRRRGMADEDTARAIRSMRDAGMSIARIAEDVAISQAKVRAILNPPPEDPAAATVEKAKRRPPQLLSVKRLRADLDDARTAVAAGELDAWGVLNRIEALLSGPEPVAGGGDAS
ncbi:ParB/RepB/Spo0J family partition protein [Isoptericola sp. NPDC055881]